MPFQKLTGEVELGGDELGGDPEARARLAARLGPRERHGRPRARSSRRAPLRLEIDLTVSGAVQGSLRSQGVAIGNDGQIHVNVSGTPARPSSAQRRDLCVSSAERHCRRASAWKRSRRSSRRSRDPTRVRVLALLEQEELAVQELMDVLGMAQSRVSRHLAILREAGLLRDRRDGTYVFYRFDPPADGPVARGVAARAPRTSTAIPRARATSPRSRR